MNLEPRELVRVIVALDRYEEVDDNYIEDLQTKIVKMCLPKTDYSIKEKEEK